MSPSRTVVSELKYSLNFLRKSPANTKMLDAPNTMQIGRIILRGVCVIRAAKSLTGEKPPVLTAEKTDEAKLIIS